MNEDDLLATTIQEAKRQVAIAETAMSEAMMGLTQRTSQLRERLLALNYWETVARRLEGGVS